MGILGAIAVASLVLVGLTIFWRRYRGTRAGFPLITAFTLGLGIVVMYGVLQAVLEPDDEPPVTAIFVTHLAMSMVSLLLLGGIMSMRDPPGVSYRKAETALGLVLAALGIVGYGAVAWSRLPLDEVNRLVVTVLPLLMTIAVVARFGPRREGLLGGAVFFALFGSYLVFFFLRPGQPDSALALLVAGLVQLASIIGMVAFFYFVARHPDLVRTPWPGGSLGMNVPRGVGVGLLCLGLAGGGYCFANLWENGWLAQSDFVPLSLLLPATAYSGCLLGVAGLTTGCNPFRGRSGDAGRTKPST
jgi:hypothetical protein